jgi:catechol 2,3-dioxygenase-like lactoylglutathione lyase family enzyme
MPSRMTESRVVLAVRNLEASIAFYEDVLGCEDVGGWDRSTGWCFLGRGTFRVMIGQCPEAKPAKQIGDHSYVAYVVVDDVDALHAEIRRRGGSRRISAPKSQPWGMREALLHTPDGHRIMFGQDID